MKTSTLPNVFQESQKKPKKNCLSDIWPPYFFPHELPAPTVGAQRKLEVRVLAKRLIGNTDLQSQEKEREKKMGEIKKRESGGGERAEAGLQGEKKERKTNPRGL